MERRLLQAGFETIEVDEVLERLERAGLVDDRAFARQLADHAFGVKRSGVRAVSGALAAAGVDRQIIAETVDPHAAEEGARADALAASRAARMRSIDPKKGFSRLTSLLMQRGFGPEVARGAARRALALDLSNDDPALPPGPSGRSIVNTRGTNEDPTFDIEAL